MTMFIDGDFPSGAICPHHCSPSCHPAQTGGESGTEWFYGCLHKAWPQNRVGDFCPIVACAGNPAKCNMQGKKFVAQYRRGLFTRKINAERKVRELIAQIEALDSLCNP